MSRRPVMRKALVVGLFHLLLPLSPDSYSQVRESDRRSVIDAMRRCLDSLSHDGSAYEIDVSSLVETGQSGRIEAQVRAWPRVQSDAEYPMEATVHGTPPDLHCGIVYWDLEHVPPSPWQMAVSRAVEHIAFEDRKPSICAFANEDCPDSDTSNGCQAQKRGAVAVCLGKAAATFHARPYEELGAAYFKVEVVIPAEGEPLVTKTVPIRVCLQRTRDLYRAGVTSFDPDAIEVLSGFRPGDELAPCPAQP